MFETAPKCEGMETDNSSLLSKHSATAAMKNSLNRSGLMVGGRLRQPAGLREEERGRERESIAQYGIQVPRRDL